MRVLVTGGCGFIGQHLVGLLTRRYNAESIFVLDAKTEAATGWSYVRGLIGRNLIRGDVTNDVDIDRALFDASPDVVIHMAAQSHVDASLSRPSRTWEVNALGTQLVAQFCADRRIPMLYCSTDEVYGETPVNEKGVPVAVDESYRHFPSNPYSASKAAGEHAVRSMGRSAGLRWAITRGSNAWGCSQLGEKLVPIACSLIQQKKKVPLHGGGRQLRQWIHVTEFAEALLIVAHRLFQGKESEIYNLAGPRLCSVEMLVEKLAEVAEITDPKSAAMPCPDRPGQDRRYLVDGSALKEATGFEPVKDILDTNNLRTLLEHYQPKTTKPMLASFVQLQETP